MEGQTDSERGGHHLNPAQLARSPEHFFWTFVMVTSNPTNLGWQKVLCSGSMGALTNMGGHLWANLFLGPKEVLKTDSKVLV